MTQRASIPNDVPRAFEDEDCDRLPFVVSAPSQESVGLLRYFILSQAIYGRSHNSRTCTVLHDLAYGAYRALSRMLLRRGDPFQGTMGWLNDTLNFFLSRQ
jgi:hypothetical protein